jgi:hypothetical protein
VSGMWTRWPRTKNPGPQLHPPDLPRVRPAVGVQLTGQQVHAPLLVVQPSLLPVSATASSTGCSGNALVRSPIEIRSGNQPSDSSPAAPS